MGAFFLCYKFIFGKIKSLVFLERFDQDVLALLKRHFSRLLAQIFLSQINFPKSIKIIE